MVQGRRANRKIAASGRLLGARRARGEPFAAYARNRIGSVQTGGRCAIAGIARCFSRAQSPLASHDRGGLPNPGQKTRSSRKCARHLLESPLESSLEIGRRGTSSSGRASTAKRGRNLALARRRGSLSWWKSPAAEWSCGRANSSQTVTLRRRGQKLSLSLGPRPVSAQVPAQLSQIRTGLPSLPCEINASW